MKISERFQFKAEDFKVGDEWMNPAVIHERVNAKLSPVFDALDEAFDLLRSQADDIDRFLCNQFHLGENYESSGTD